MATVNLDLVDGSTVRQTAAGIEVIRRGLVRDVRGGAAQRQRIAFQTPGLPRYGDNHPSFPDLRVVDVQLETVDVSTFEATIVYRVPTPDELATMEADGTVIEREWFSINVTEEVNEDVYGNRLYHWYSGNPLTPVIIGNGVKFQRSIFRQLVTKNEPAEVQKPSVGVRLTISERKPVKENLTIAGTINASWWSGYPPQTWLIGGISSRWERTRWINAWELFFKADTWKFRSRVEYFGAPPDDAVLGNGIADFDVYRSSNFGLLGFTV